MQHAAEVRAHDRVMRYRRWGSGPLLLVLGAESPDAFWPGLPERLAAQFKVIVPEVPSDAPDAVPWLDCLLDGLGASDIAVVAGIRHRATALALAEGDHVS